MTTEYRDEFLDLYQQMVGRLNTEAEPLWYPQIDDQVSHNPFATPIGDMHGDLNRFAAKHHRYQVLMRASFRVAETFAEAKAWHQLQKDQIQQFRLANGGVFQSQDFCDVRVHSRVNDFLLRRLEDAFTRILAYRDKVATVIAYNLGWLPEMDRQGYVLYSSIHKRLLREAPAIGTITKIHFYDDDLLEVNAIRCSFVHGLDTAILFSPHLQATLQESGTRTKLSAGLAAPQYGTFDEPIGLCDRFWRLAVDGTQALYEAGAL